MKKLILAAFWVALGTALPYFGQTQTPDTSTIEKLQRYVAGPLDKSQVPTVFWKTLVHLLYPWLPLMAI